METKLDSKLLLPLPSINSYIQVNSMSLGERCILFFLIALCELRMTLDRKIVTVILTAFTFCVCDFIFLAFMSQYMVEILIETVPIKNRLGMLSLVKASINQFKFQILFSVHFLSTLKTKFCFAVKIHLFLSSLIETVSNRIEQDHKMYIQIVPLILTQKSTS